MLPAVRLLSYLEAIALAGIGQLDAVDSLLDLVADLPWQPMPGCTYSRGSQTAGIALELKVLGHREASAAAMERSLAWFATQPASELLFERGQHQS